MNAIVLLIAAGGLAALGFLTAFVWAVQTGQFDDTSTPPLRMLVEEGPEIDEPVSSPTHGGSSHVE